MLKSIVLFLLLFITNPVFADCSKMVFKGVYPISKEPVKILCHKRYVVGYSVDRQAPLWAAEVLTSDNIKASKSFRLNAFRYHPSIPQHYQPQFSDFVNNDYDRGHLVNFENLADDSLAASESFFMTNMIAQQYQNNRGIWRVLENRVRGLAESRKEIFIVTGVIFDDNRKLPAGTSIPTRIYKMILAPNSREAFTIIIPNKQIDSSNLDTFITTLQELKKTNKHTNVFPTRYQFKNKTILK